MNHIHLTLSLIFIALGSSVGVVGQDAFTGSIRYTPVSDDRPESDVKRIPEAITIYSDGQRFRYEETVNGETRVVISDFAKNSQFTLITMLGQKIALKSPEDVIKEMKKRPILANVDDHSQVSLPIARRKTYSTMVQEVPYMYTPEFNFFFPGMPALPGACLGFVYSKSSVMFVANEIKAGDVSDDLFMVPENYTIMNHDELGAMFGLPDSE